MTSFDICCMIHDTILLVHRQPSDRHTEIESTIISTKLSCPQEHTDVIGEGKSVRSAIE